jgi:hypothetical protein
VTDSITIEKEDIDMDQRASDQGWQQLQANIERFLGQTLESDGRRVEYRPQFIASLSGISSGHPQKGTGPTPSDIGFGQRGKERRG